MELSMKKEQLEKVLAQVKEHRAATLTFEIDELTITRQFVPHQRLILLGGGYISQAVCNFAAQLDFDVTVVDDRPSFANQVLFPNASEIICDGFQAAIEKLGITEFDYVAILTRGHRWDKECLEKILPRVEPYYLGLVGSRRRVHGLFELLEKEGIAKEKLDKIFTPIGLNIGAKTPKEIAIAIVAELIQKRSHSQMDEGILEQKDTDFSLLQDLAEHDDRVIALVVKTVGSVPVSTGAMMAADLLGRTAGTVGGGCGEYAILAEAREILRTGTSKLVTVDMSNDVAEEEGMVCGGKMQVWIEPCC